MSHALNHLRLAAEIAETNLPINVREGNYAQADLEQAVAHDCRNAMSALEHYKMASFLFPHPSFTDKARVAGRTAFEGGVGAYGGGSLAALAMGALAKANPRLQLAKAFMPVVGGAAGIGGGLGAMHGFNAGMGNMRQRLNPWEVLKRKLGFA